MPVDDGNEQKQPPSKLELKHDGKGNGPSGRNIIGAGSGDGGSGGLKKTAVGPGDGFEGFRKLYSWIKEALKQAAENSDPWNSVLSTLSENKNVIACVLANNLDASILAAMIPASMNAESIAQSSVATYMSTEMVIKKMGQDRIHSILSQTSDGYSIIVDIGPAILFILTTTHFDDIDESML